MSRGEALTIWSFLAYGEESERERLRLSGLSRTTYHDSRRKAYASKWIQDRYVPDPAALGYYKVAICMSRPMIDRAELYLKEAASMPGAVVLWSMAGTAFGVFFLRDGAHLGAVKQMWGRSGMVSDAEFIELDPSRGDLPVFFDYEGLWGHMNGQQGTHGYPRPLPSGASSKRASPRDIGATLGEAAALIGSGGPVYLHRSAGLRPSRRTLVDGGVLKRRVFLGPGALPPIEGRDANRILFITGKVQRDFPAIDLLSSLVSRARVYPFLVASGSEGAVIGLMGQSSPPTNGPPPSGFSSTVLPAVRQFLTDIKMFHGDSATLNPIMDHRYDRLLLSSSHV